VPSCFRRLTRLAGTLQRREVDWESKHLIRQDASLQEHLIREHALNYRSITIAWFSALPPL
jgi:hypothetical protein